jgi:hypothetical protein
MSHRAGSQRSNENPLKSENESKPQTRALADHAHPTAPSPPVSQTVTGQGGAQDKGGRILHLPDTAHPSQRGGVRADDPAADPRFIAPENRAGTKLSGPSPADLPHSRRTGTLRENAPTGQTRTGKTNNNRKTPGR